MKHKPIRFLSCLFVLGVVSLVWADDPTSTFVSLQPLNNTNLPGSSTANAVQFEIWDSATAGSMIFSEAHSVDTDANKNITNDTGFADLLLGRCTPQPCAGGLDPTKFQAGSSRYLDVTVGGVSQLAARIPLYATPFSLNPGPKGDKGDRGDQGDKGDKGDKGDPGAPGVVQAVSAADDSIAVAGTATNPTVRVNFTGSGSSATAARGDHTHALSGTGNTGVGNTVMPNNGGSNNSAFGNGAMNANTAGSYNTAIGTSALYANTSGNTNTAVGFTALVSNTTGSNNTAVGDAALLSNLGSSGNTAVGANALWSNRGDNNTAVGNGALYSNTMARDNSAVGANALGANGAGIENTALGSQALKSSTSGNYNTAVGFAALQFNTTGTDNTAMGDGALMSNTDHHFNTAIGYLALANATGSNNTALGYDAGVFVTTGSNNIYIGNTGEAADNNTIRIGTGSTATYLSGIVGIDAGSNKIPVYIDAVTGKLGQNTSSRRFKYDIHDMDEASAKLLRLRPVTFRYKRAATDGSHPVQYGLIAEEVAKVYPGLVQYGPGGEANTVRYDMLPAMLLNELQKQQRQFRAQRREMRAKEARWEQRFRGQREELRHLRSQLTALQSAMARAGLRPETTIASAGPR